MVQTSSGVQLDVWVQPGARRTECAGIHDRALKLRVTARPQQAAATAQAVALLVRFFAVRAQEVTLLRGATSRRTRVEIGGLSVEHARRQREIMLSQ